MKEEDIRPQYVFDEYLRLAAIDAEKYFSIPDRTFILCPACSGKGKRIFDKHGFSYDECPTCQTIFVSPRPSPEKFYNYYQHSESAKYFATTFYEVTKESRLEKLWKPKVQRILSIMKDYEVEDFTCFDVGGGYGIFAEEFRKVTKQNVTVIEPGPEASNICRKKGLDVIQGFLEQLNTEQLNASGKVFVSFELVEHLADPCKFLEKLNSFMSSGDYFK